MRLVVELDDLKTVGLAVREHDAAYAAVCRLIAASPSLTDVVGVASGEHELKAQSTGEQIIEALRDADDWMPTSAIATSLNKSEATTLSHLKRMRAEGEVESRKGEAGRNEWRPS
jgi:biotin operon repressor